MYQLQIPAHQDLTTTESDVFHINHAIKEEFGMINYLNAYAQILLSSTVLNVLDALQVNFMPTVDVSAQTEHSLMEFNVLLKLLIDVLVLPIPTGMELIVSAYQVSQEITINATAKASSLVTIVKDAPQSQTLFSETESVNVIPVMLI